MSTEERFFEPDAEQRIVAAIADAERLTSGEIRIHIERKGGRKDPMKRALRVFEELKMHQTDLRNGVLFYLATEDHKFSILGDEGIDKVVPPHFWEDVRDLVQAHFKKGEFEDGLINGVRMAGEKLAEFFPIQHDDTNELSNEISES
jgi:uncharacterized membrane protein